MERKSKPELQNFLRGKLFFGGRQLLLDLGNTLI